MTFPSYFQRRSHRSIILVSLILMVAGLHWRSRFYEVATVAGVQQARASLAPVLSKAFVVASVVREDPTWLLAHFSDWDVRRYVVDNQTADLTVPINKGREAMVYLTYIIDNYNDLPDLAVFLHGARYQWHNDDPLYDGIPMLKGLQLPYLISQGYANLRCVWALGCPSELILNGAEIDKSRTTNIAYAQAFQQLFPGEELPSIIAVPCCAQFSVTRSTILQRPVEDYQHYRQWLLETPLEDHISGRIFEYSWHFIFGKPYIHCPNAQDCYCKTFGLCSLECAGDKECGERWSFPPSSLLPKGWPEIGWDGQERSGDVLESLRKVSMLKNDQIQSNSSSGKYV